MPLTRGVPGTSPGSGNSDTNNLCFQRHPNLVFRIELCIVGWFLVTFNGTGVVNFLDFSLLVPTAKLLTSAVQYQALRTEIFRVSKDADGISWDFLEHFGRC